MNQVLSDLKTILVVEFIVLSFMIGIVAGILAQRKRTVEIPFDPNEVCISYTDERW